MKKQINKKLIGGETIVVPHKKQINKKLISGETIVMPHKKQIIEMQHQQATHHRVLTSYIYIFNDALRYF